MPSVSKKQQKFMGIVRAIQKGEADPSDFNKDAQDAAKKMKKSSVKKYAKTKHKGLPNKKVNEAQVTKSIMTNPNNRKLYFTLVDGNDVKLIDAKTWLKSSLKDVSSTVNQDKVIKSIVRKQKQFNKKVEWNQWKSKNKPSFVEQMKWLMDNGFVKNVNKGGIKEERDYKAEYKKFQSSTKAKKYRAELNKYNRQKGTYGNGDGKDASHKGGKIVGFEKESTNRGRAEKSRLKKEINDYVGSVIDETINENPAAIAAAQRMVVQSKGKKISVNTARNSRYKDKDPAAHKKAKSMFSRLLDKFRKKNESQMLLQIAKQLKEADQSVDEIKVWDLNEKCWKGYEKKGMKTMFGKRYPNCVKKKKSESVNEVSDKQKRKIYKKAFGKEYDDSKRKQAPLPLDIAYKVALNKLKKKKSESVNEKTLGGKDVTSGIDKGTKITFSRNLPTGYRYLAGKTFKVSKKGINTFNVLPDGSNNEKDTKTLDAPTILKLLKNKNISKIVNSKGKKLNKESVNEAPSGLVKKAIELAKSMGGNMTGAIKRIEKMKKGLSKQKDVKKAIRMANESINETPYELGGMKVYSKADGLKKVKSMKKTAGAKIYKVTKTKTKLYGTNPVTMYNLHTKNKNHSTNSNPYGLDMMKGAYLIPVKESVNESKELTKIDTMLKNQIKKIGKEDKKAGMELMKLYKKHWVEFSIKAKKHMNEGTCGYGVDGKLGEEPAGPHLLKKKKSVKEARLDAKQLLQQLGGNKFIAMTGAKNLVVDKAKNTLHMKIGRNSKGISHLRIKLTGADLYDMEFLQVRAGNVKVKAKETGLYADQLQKMFTKHTGMYTSL